MDDSLYLNLVKEAETSYSIELKLKEDLFIYDDGGTVKLSK